MRRPAERRGDGRHLEPHPVAFRHLVHPEPPLPAQPLPGLGQLLPEPRHLLPDVPGRVVASRAGKKAAGLKALELKQEHPHGLH
ncbi:MAG TPA: hypothetical protein VIL08_01545, partial [Limnochorda sp.]